MRISDEIARRLGILAMSRGIRGKQLDYLSERWFIQDGRANFFIADTIKQKSKLLSGGPHRQRSSPELQNKQPDTVKRPLENIVVSGFRIVHSEFLLL